LPARLSSVIIPAGYVVQITLSKVLSFVIAIAYTILAIHLGGLGYWRFCLVWLIPLALIWFPEEIGELTGFYKTGYVNVQTPGVIISFIGWFFLVGLPVLIWLVRRR
jgi:hypothetical protein